MSHADHLDADNFSALARVLRKIASYTTDDNPPLPPERQVRRYHKIAKKAESPYVPRHASTRNTVAATTSP